MPQNLQIICAETERLPDPTEAVTEAEDVRSRGAKLARRLEPALQRAQHDSVSSREAALRALEPMLSEFEAPLAGRPVSHDFHWVHDNARLLHSTLQHTAELSSALDAKPGVVTPSGEILPRILAITEDFLNAVQYRFDEQAFASYVDAFQEVIPLDITELWEFLPCLRFALLREIVARIPRLIKDPEGSYGLGVCIRSLHDIAQVSWVQLIEPLIMVDRILREDPSGTYPRMDLESRERYWKVVTDVAKHSGLKETEVALQAIALARKAGRKNYSDERTAARQIHVGYYLIAEGAPLLHSATGFRPPFRRKLHSFLQGHANGYYIAGIQVVTLAIVAAAMLALTGFAASPWILALAALAFWLPCSQAAVEFMNYVTHLLLPAQLLPKLDFSGGIPDDSVTLVVVPALLLGGNQVYRLVEDLEVRFLGNRDRNLHFALLTDLPDSKERASEDDPLVELCASLIARLNDKYAGQRRGSFLLLHRHRVYNPDEGVWMGWERKRGKLLDLNKLLCQQADGFPVKVGDVSMLENVRFVITLDSDTELPRDTAQRMVGTLAHPLNRAIIDRGRNVVTAGYGILQPRVSISVQSAARSRLATIYAGQTGLDVYTRAVSDVYQDLFGEGIFTGKGIYEVDTMLQVLGGRFPQNALLSHDLIEGCYLRTGLATDIEIIDDYPSTYSAHNRRKHRWLRGDWQIAEWLLPRVPKESGERVPNPLSAVSRWKIFDNLRRSLLDLATFLLFVLGWVVLPGSPLRWTLAAVALLFASTWTHCGVALLRAAVKRKWSIAQDGIVSLFTGNADAFLRLVFLAHHTLLSIDAILRVMMRRLVTHRRLLEWETAAEAELNHQRRNLVDVYFDWMPMLVAAAALLVLGRLTTAALAAAPILLLWVSSKPLVGWLNNPPRLPRYEMPQADRQLLRRAALATWRYFAEFSNEEHHWLIPDNFQKEPLCAAGRTSPTNLGLLLNARQVACEFGYLTVPEFAEVTAKSLESIACLPKLRGHLFNWYDTRTLSPLTPRFVSSADSGNLVASLWALQQGTQERLQRPLLEACLLQGVLDCISDQNTARRITKMLKGGNNWLGHIFALAASYPPASSDEGWRQKEGRARLNHVVRTAHSFCPWLLPEFAAIRQELLNSTGEAVPLQHLPYYIESLEARLHDVMATALPEQQAYCANLRLMLPEARKNAERLIAEMTAIASRAAALARDTDFGFLLQRGRKLLSVGYDVEAQRLHGSCYDLLASEARLGVFVAIAKEEIPQEAWFLLGRQHIAESGRPVLLSWTGTMFEYLMPALWMRTYPNTLLDRARQEAVRSQQAYAAQKHIPWGISESAYAARDENGYYQYHAFGVPSLRLHKGDDDPAVISPYSSMLALIADPVAAVANLRRMAKEGWLAEYGFYEAADYTAGMRVSKHDSYELIRSWMAHHQGMSLLAMANLMHDNVVQRWFHADPQVQATELLLQEKPVSHLRPTQVKQRATNAGRKARRRIDGGSRTEPGMTHAAA